MRDMQVDFSAGQLSPRTSGRVDTVVHRAGAIEMTNFIALPQGPAEARPGLVRIDDLDEPYKTHRVVPMTIDHMTSILLVINDERIYIYYLKQDGSILSAYPLIDEFGDKVYGKVNYYEDDIFSIQFTPFEGRMYMAHPNYETKILSFDTSTQTIAIMGFAASYERWDDSTSSAYVAGDTIYFEGKIYRALVDDPTELSGDTETYYFLYTPKIITTLENVVATIPAHETTMVSIGDMCVHNSKVWVLGTKEKADKDGNYISWYYPEPLPTYVDMNYNIVIQWDACDTRLLKVSNTNRSPGYPTDPSGKAWLHVCDLPIGSINLPYFNATAHKYDVGDFFHYEGGVYTVVVETKTADPPVPGDRTVGEWVYVSDAPTFASEGNYPNMLVFHDRRMFVLGTMKKPGTIYASYTGEVTEFTIGIKADQGFQIELNTEVAELATWARSRRDLIIGSANSEWVVTGGDGPITPTSVFAFPQSKAGAMRDGAVDISDMLVFFQKGGRRLLRFVFSNDTQSYITPDMSQLSEDIFEPGVRQFALQSNPDFILWCVMNDGTLVGGTYNPATQSFGWHRHDTDGFFESVTVTTSNFGEDEVWFVVKREISGTIERQIEKFAPRRQPDIESMIYLDDAEIIGVTDGKGVVSEDKYNSTLSVLYGGAAHPDVVADATGQVEFQNKLFTKAVVGRPYFPKLRPQRLDQAGSSLDTGTRISRAAIRVYKTLGIEVGADEDHLHPIEFRSTSGVMGQPPPLYTGEIATTVDSSFGDENWMLIRRNQPFPCMILGVTYEIKGGQI